MLQVTLFRDFLEDRRTSMEVYGNNLTRELAAIDSQDVQLTQFRPQLGAAGYLPAAANLRMRAARYVEYPRHAGAAQGQVNHILDHGYAHLMRVLDPSRTVLTVHDLIPILAGRGMIRGVERPRRSWLSEYTARFYRRAARIIAISENTRSDLIRHCGCDPGRVEVIYFGNRTDLSPMTLAERAAARVRLGLPQGEELILITGQQYYKNQETSLAVVRQLEDEGRAVRLVRVGRDTAMWGAAVQGAGIRRPVIQLSFVPDENMCDLYNAVDCLLFPSWYEGFGLPPVEAMACGTPVVTSNAASLPEAAGDAALTADPDDVETLAAHVARLLDDVALREEQVKRGLQHAKRFDWVSNAARVMEIYREVGRRRTSSGNH